MDRKLVGSLLPKLGVLTKQLLLEVEFGMPSKNCQNFGICHINPASWNVIQADPNKQKLAKALLTVYDSGILEFDFFKNSLIQEKIDLYFNRNIFVIQEDFNWKCTSTSGDFEIRIPKGEYQVFDFNSVLKVYFRPEEF